MSGSVYLDHNATSPLARAALDAFVDASAAGVGNASSTHRDGVRARAILDRARQTLADLIGATADELIFTSGGTESNNLAILGARGDPRRTAVAVSAVEHPSVLEVAEAVASRGGRRQVVPVQSSGLVDVVELERRVDDETRLVSIQLANHETGVVQPIAALAPVVRRCGALLHVDAVQAFGKLPIRVRELDVDLLTITAHKIGGPVGIGALYVRSGVELQSILFGGSQENHLRPGTSSVALAAAFAGAATRVCARRDETADRHRRLRSQLIGRIQDVAPGVVIHTPLDERASTPNTLSLSFPGHDRESLLINLDLHGVRVSAGAACASGAITPSPVLTAMRLPDPLPSTAIRVSFGPSTTADELDVLIDALIHALPRAVRDSQVF